MFFVGKCVAMSVVVVGASGALIVVVMMVLVVWVRYVEDAVLIVGMCDAVCGGCTWLEVEY